MFSSCPEKTAGGALKSRDQVGVWVSSSGPGRWWRWLASGLPLSCVPHRDARLGVAPACPSLLHRPRPGLHCLPPGCGDVALLAPLGLLLLLHGRPPGTGQPGIKRDGHSEPERQWCAWVVGGKQRACSPTLNLMP